MDGDLILNIHLVKLVNTADAVVSQHQGTGLNAELIAVLLLTQVFCETIWLLPSSFVRTSCWDWMHY